MLAPDPIAAGFARARWRAVGRTLVGFLAFAAIWGAVVGLAALFGIPMRHAMYLGLVASIVYAISRERRRRRASHEDRVERRRRWHEPIAWARRAPKPVAPGDAISPAAQAFAPQGRRGPRGGTMLSNAGWGETLLWIIVVAVAVTAFVVYVAYSTQGT